MLKHPTKFDHFGYAYLTPIKSWGMRGFHPGLDYNKGTGNSDLGQAVYAFGSGTVVYANSWVYPGWGKLVVIEHKFVDEKGNNRIVWGRYAHLHKVFVSKGQVVDENTCIGQLGKTGTSVAHLHFDVAKFDISAKPYQYIWGWKRDAVAKAYANIEFMVANWSYLR